MSVSKLTSDIQPLDQIDKINEIIDNLVTVDSSLSSSSENPVQNKVINTALEGKSTVTFVDWTVS